MLIKLYQISLIILISMITACATSPDKPSGSETQQASRVIPAGSPFSKLKVGMSPKQAHDLIGEPTDINNHMTGKAFIPFYFGNDTFRMEELYKGQGQIVYTGVGIGGVNFRIYQIVYDPNEDGYNNK